MTGQRLPVRAPGPVLGPGGHRPIRLSVGVCLRGRVQRNRAGSCPRGLCSSGGKPSGAPRRRREQGGGRRATPAACQLQDGRGSLPRTHRGRRGPGRALPAAPCPSTSADSCCLGSSCEASSARPGTCPAHRPCSFAPSGISSTQPAVRAHDTEQGPMSGRLSPLSAGRPPPQHRGTAGREGRARPGPRGPSAPRDENRLSPRALLSHREPEREVLSHTHQSPAHNAPRPRRRVMAAQAPSGGDDGEITAGQGVCAGSAGWQHRATVLPQSSELRGAGRTGRCPPPTPRPPGHGGPRGPCWKASPQRADSLRTGPGGPARVTRQAWAELLTLRYLESNSTFCSSCVSSSLWKDFSCGRTEHAAVSTTRGAGRGRRQAGKGAGSLGEADGHHSTRDTGRPEGKGACLIPQPVTLHRQVGPEEPGGSRTDSRTAVRMSDHSGL